MVFIAGSKGFVGNALCKEFDRTGVGFVGKDLPESDLSQGSFIDGTFETFINTAAISHKPDVVKDPLTAFLINVMMVQLFLDDVREKNIKHFIHLSTCSVYSYDGMFPPIEENGLKPQDLYAAQKAGIDLICQAYYETFNTPVTVIRTSNVYGMGDKKPRLLKNLVENAVDGKELVIKGDPQRTYTFTYIKDLIDGIKLVMSKPEDSIGEVFNIVGFEENSIQDAVDIIVNLIPGTRVRIEKNERNNETKRGLVSWTKACGKLGYIPKYRLEEGIKEYIDEYRASKVPQN